MIRTTKIWLACLLWFSIAVSSCFANTQTAEDMQLEARLKILSTELRCLVCQSATLAESDASLAEDLRNKIRTLMREGKTDEEIIAYLVERYGDFVHYRPPVNANTALLWFGPFIMLLIGVVTLIVILKKRASQPTTESPEPNLNGD